MFRDWAWIDEPAEARERELIGMLIRAKSRLTVVELGAGKAIPTVRIRPSALRPGRRNILGCQTFRAPSLSPGARRVAYNELLNAGLPSPSVS
jgi:hypothetical protein